MGMVLHQAGTIVHPWISLDGIAFFVSECIVCADVKKIVTWHRDMIYMCECDAEVE